MLFAELLPWFPVSPTGVRTSLPSAPAAAAGQGWAELPALLTLLSHPLEGAGAPSPGVHTEMCDQDKTTQEHPGASLDPAPWHFINNRDWRTQQTPNEQKTPSAEQGPPATARFETEDQPPGQKEEISEEIPQQDHLQKAKGKHKSCLLSFGRGALNTARGTGGTSANPWSTRMAENSQNREQTQRLETVTKTQKQKWKCTKI